MRLTCCWENRIRGERFQLKVFFRQLDKESQQLTYTGREKQEGKPENFYYINVYNVYYISPKECFVGLNTEKLALS